MISIGNLMPQVLTSTLSTAVAPQDEGPSCGASLVTANSGAHINACITLYSYPDLCVRVLLI